MNHKRLRIFCNIVLPVMILLPLICIMVGCVVIPTWDHKLLTGTKQDFRSWGSQNQYASPLQLGEIKRSQIEAMFGPPKLVSDNRRTVAYVMGTENGIAIWPLCFGAGFVNGDTHVLKLVYSDDGRLKRVVPLMTDRYPPMYWMGANIRGYENANPMHGAEDLLRKDNEACPTDEVIEGSDRSLMPVPKPATRP